MKRNSIVSAVRQFKVLAAALTSRARGAHVRNNPIEQLECRRLLSASSGSWTQVSYPAAVESAFGAAGNSQAGPSFMFLLTDGSVLIQCGNTNLQSNWARLSPDSSGNYIAGTISATGGTGKRIIGWSSQVLPSGNVWIEGGEEGLDGANSAYGFTYNSGSGTWSSNSAIPFNYAGASQLYGDVPSELLASGQVLCGDDFNNSTYLYNPGTDTWTETGSFATYNGAFINQDESTFVKLGNGNVMAITASELDSNGVNGGGTFQGQITEIYNSAAGTWSTGPLIPVQIKASYGSNSTDVGPATLLPNGNLLVVGNSGNTAVYSPSTNSFTAGPSVSGVSGLGATWLPGENSGAMLPDGNFVFIANNSSNPNYSALVDYDYTTNQLTNITPTTGPAGSAFNGNAIAGMEMVGLPNGHLLLSCINGLGTGSGLYDYAPGATPLVSTRPTINSIAAASGVSIPANTYLLTGTQLTGIAEGTSFGDDFQNATNYPIVRVFDQTAGTVAYAKTTNWTPGVAQGATITSTYFTLPSTMITGHTYIADVIANGIASTNQVVISNLPTTTVSDASFQAPALAAGTSQQQPTGTSWTYTGTAGIYSNGATLSNPTTPAANAPDGTQAAYLVGGGSNNSAMSQSMSFASPGVYDVSFQMNESMPAPVFQNAGFESGNTGWTFTGLAGTFANGSGYNAVDVPERNQGAYLQGYPGYTNGDINQVANFTSAGTYNLSFLASASNFSGPGQSIVVLLDGVAQGTFTPASASYWQTFTQPLTVTAGNHTIDLQATVSSSSAYAALVDNVTLAGTATPQSINVSVDGGTPITVNSPYVNSWNNFVVPVSITTAGSHTITFSQSNTQPLYAFLDNVSVTETNPFLTGGSFETPSVGTGSQFDPTGTGWNFTGLASVFGNGVGWNNVAVPDGSQGASLQGYPGYTPGRISQLVTFPVAGTYNLSLQAVAPTWGTGQSIDIYLDGVLKGTLTPTSTTTWQNFTQSLTISAAGSHTIALAAHVTNANSTALLDNVSICQSFSTPVFQNASFENPSAKNSSNQAYYAPSGAGWAFAGNSGVLTNASPFAGAKAPNGVQAGFLQGGGAWGSNVQNGQISESLFFSSPRVYNLTFKTAYGYAQGQQIGVYLDGVLQTTITPTSTSYSAQSLNLTIPTTGLHTISFAAMVFSPTINSLATALIDNVGIA